MNIIAWVVYIIVQVIFIPLSIVGLVLVSIKQLWVSRNLGVSGTAISAIGARWLMHVFAIRKDNPSANLYRVLPNGSELGLWLLFFPGYLHYKISGKNTGYVSVKEYGKEGVSDIPNARTIYFDRLIGNARTKAQQFIVMGAGYDTRCYGELKDTELTFFELDQLKTQGLKRKYLKKAGIDASHVAFVAIDFSKENWYLKLKQAGYDPSKRSMFLWEGVTPYLSENDVRAALREMKAHSAPGSIILADFYSSRILAFKGVKSTNERFSFHLNLSADKKDALTAFLESEDLSLGNVYFMGHKTVKGVLGVVAEIIV